jgi:hypothetical protein
MTNGCSFCERTFEDYIHLQVNQEDSRFCSWTCLIAFAAVKAHNSEAHLISRLNTTQDKLDEAELWLAQYQAGIWK